MPDLLQFPCPACGVTLRVPVSMAGATGPCPACQRMIVAPVPAAPQPQPPAPPAAPALVPFQDPPTPRAVAPQQPPVTTPVVAPVRAPAPALPPEPPAREPEIPAPAPPIAAAAIQPPAPEILPQPQRPLPPEPAPSSPPSVTPLPIPVVRDGTRAILVLSCVLTGVLASGAGYLLGRSGLFSPSTPALPVNPPTAPRSTAETPPPTPGVPAAPAAPVAVSAAPEAALRSFLAAGTVEERRKWVMSPALVGPRMEAWYSAHPEGPLEVGSIKLESTQTAEDGIHLIFLFAITTPAVPDGFGVMVVETATGWRVDWDTFIEFHGDRFQQFVEGKEGDSGNYHLALGEKEGPGPVFPGSEKLTPFRISSTLPNREQLAYVPTGSALHKQLTLAIGGGQPITLVLRLDRRTPAGGKSYLEITAITANTWFPRLR